MTPILGALIGIVATLIIVAVAIVFIVRTRERDDAAQTAAGSTGKLASAKSSSAAIDASSSNLTAGVKNELLPHEDEHNPDVVPNKNGNTSFLSLMQVAADDYAGKCGRIGATGLRANISFSRFPSRDKETKNGATLSADEHFPRKPIYKRIGAYIPYWVNS